MLNQKNFFLKPKMPRQKQYEALRAIIVDELPTTTVSKKYGYSTATLYSRVRDFKAGKLMLFPETKPGPKKRHTPEKIRQLVLKYRKEGLSVSDIQARVKQEGYTFSTSTAARILSDAQLPKLQRRSTHELGKTQKNQTISERAQPLDFDKQ